MARLLILGAGLHQLSGIRAARELGCEIITADNRPHNPGHALGDRFVDCSTVDVDAVAEVAEALAVDGVVTFASDVSTPATAAAAQRLGLAGPAPAAVDQMSDKMAFREAARRSGLPVPAVIDLTRTVGEFEDLTRRLGQPFVVKPPDASGSKGVTVVADARALAPAVTGARTASRTDRAFAESFLPGLEVGGDAFLVDGRIKFAALTDKRSSGVVVTGHVAPSPLDEETQRRVVDAVAATAAAVGYRDGPVNFDVMVDGAAATVIEMSPRTGGNGIPLVIERVHGAPLLRWTIQQALGRALDSPAPPPADRAGSLVIGSPRAGEVAAIRAEPAVRLRVPELHSIDLVVHPGDRVEPFVHGGHGVGVAVFDLPEGRRYADTARAVEESVGLELS